MENKMIKGTKEGLLRALNLAKFALADSDLWEPGIYFHFRDKSIQAFNGSVYIEYPFDMDITGSVKGAEFHKLISKLPDGDLEIGESKGQLIIKGKKIKVKMAIAQFENLPEVVPNKRSRIKLPQGFWDGVKFCSFSVDKKLNHPQLSCLNITGPEIISCDNYRATKYRLVGGVGSSFLLSITGDFTKHGFTYFKLEEDWIHFYDQMGTRLSCRQVEGEYPPGVGDFFKMKGESFLMPKRLVEVIDRTKIFMESSISFFQDQKISISLSKNKLTCRGEGELGFIEESIRTKYSGDEIQFFIHPILLSEILAHASEAVIGEERILFTGENFFHVVGIERGE